MAITNKFRLPTVIPQPDGSRLIEWIVVSTTVGVNDEFELDASIGWQTPCELVLFEMELTPGGVASTVQPEIGTETGFSLDTNEEVAIAPSAALHVRIASDVVGVGIFFPAETDKLVVRPVPDLTTDTNITTRITMRVWSR